MSKILNFSSLVLFGALLVGCKSTITNLSVIKQPRNVSGMYPVEVIWDSSQQTVRTATLTPYVVVDFESYPMRRTLGMTNRWETVIPVPPGKNTVFFHFRFDYDYNSFGKPKKDCRLSTGYRLDIVEK